VYPPFINLTFSNPHETSFSYKIVCLSFVSYILAPIWGDGNRKMGKIVKNCQKRESQAAHVVNFTTTGKMWDFGRKRPEFCDF